MATGNAGKCPPRIASSSPPAVISSRRPIEHMAATVNSCIMRLKPQIIGAIDAADGAPGANHEAPPNSVRPLTTKDDQAAESRRAVRPGGRGSPRQSSPRQNGITTEPLGRATGSRCWQRRPYSRLKSDQSLKLCRPARLSRPNWVSPTANPIAKPTINNQCFVPNLRSSHHPASASTQTMQANSKPTPKSASCGTTSARFWRRRKPRLAFD